MEAIGYGQWPRLREVMEFARRMGYIKLGLAFCAGLHKEAAIVDRIFRKNALRWCPSSARRAPSPKTGRRSPRNFGWPGSYEAMCNPIAQAELLNRAETQLNICLGLCVGHDSLFYKYSKALVTTLVAKDRVTGNNPAAAIYWRNGYMKDRLGTE